eukprot:scaffold300_cov258-Pinguiococcus_pyrenoidosus.AAC.30
MATWNIASCRVGAWILLWPPCVELESTRFGGPGRRCEWLPRFSTRLVPATVTRSRHRDTHTQNWKELCRQRTYGGFLGGSRRLVLIDFRNEITTLDAVAFHHGQRADHPSDGSGHGGLHLHCTEHHERVALLDDVALLGAGLHHHTRHGRADASHRERIGLWPCRRSCAAVLVEDANDALLSVQLEVDGAVAVFFDFVHAVELDVQDLALGELHFDGLSR